VIGFLPAYIIIHTFVSGFPNLSFFTLFFALCLVTQLRLPAIMSLIVENMTTPTMMQGVVYNGRPYEVAVVDLPLPSLMAETDAIVRIKTAGICGTDLHMYHGFRGADAPWGMGHEALGYVSEIGSAVSSLEVGDYVVIPDNVASGRLEMEPSAVGVFGVGRGLPGLQGKCSMNTEFTS